MNIERFKSVSPNGFSPLDIILEWKRDGVVMHHGNELSMNIIKQNGKLTCPDESVDKVVIDCISKLDDGLSSIIREARRILKKDGRLFISIEEKTTTFSFWGKFLQKWNDKSLVDQIAEMISDEGLLIDKNFIVDGSKIYLEIVKLESEYLKKKIRM